MTVLASSTQAYSNVVKKEFEPEWGYAKKHVVYNGTAVATPIGTVLGSYIASPVGTAGANVGTGNGVMGAITMTSVAGLVLGTYIVRIYRAVTNAGDFQLIDPNGKVIAAGQVAGAFSAAGFAFTWADGATDFIVGDYITIVVTGTVKYKLMETTATDGTQIPSVVVVGDATGRPLSTTPVVNTDTTFLVLYRGPSAVADASLTFGASVTTGAVRTAALAALTAASGIDVLTQI
jgi:hypothetical protein